MFVELEKACLIEKKSILFWRKLNIVHFKKENFKYDYFFNKCNIKPSVLYGGNEII